MFLLTQLLGAIAKIIKYRFNEDLRTVLLESHWWEIDFPEVLRQSIVPPLDDPQLMLSWLNEQENLPKISSPIRRLISNSTGTEWKII